MDRSPKKTKKEVSYIYDENLARCTNKIPNIKNRARMVHELIKAYGLSKQMNWISSTPATFDELKVFHASSYIDFLAACDEKDKSRAMNNDEKAHDSDEELSEEDVDVDAQEFQNEYKLTHVDFGFGYDCPIFKNMGEFACVIAGGTLTACRELMTGCQIAINWCGGWHHAQRDEAGGFCTVNDIVLACHMLQKKFPRILYLDVDAHHGDGVENAFSLTPNILTVSFHVHEPGFYPGTGSLDSVGKGRGKYHSINVPLKSFITDSQFTYVFDKVFSQLKRTFSADAVVVQCGVDAVSGDPIGMGNLTEKGLGQCISKILTLGLPTLFLGGGGYNLANAARCWAYLTAVITRCPISSDIPDHDNFLLYGPDYDLSITASPRQSENTADYLENIVAKIERNLDNLPPLVNYSN